jgi:hypothetical protein
MIKRVIIEIIAEPVPQTREMAARGLADAPCIRPDYGRRELASPITRGKR